MSLDYEVRSDDDYSDSVPRERIMAVVVGQWSAERRTDDFLVYTRDSCHVEVSLGRPEAPNSKSEAVVWVGFRVPAGASLRSGDRSLRMAMAVAQAVGWRVFDPQRDGYVDPSELEPGPSVREALARLWREARLVPWRILCAKVYRRTLRQSPLGVALILSLGCLAAVMVGWLFRFSFETRPILSLALAACGSTGLLALDVLTDVLGEIHQEASGARKSWGR